VRWNFFSEALQEDRFPAGGTCVRHSKKGQCCRLAKGEHRVLGSVNDPGPRLLSGGFRRGKRGPMSVWFLAATPVRNELHWPRG
jgi:hypothetical protein